MLAYHLHKMEKYSGPWNFGTERNTITRLDIIEKIIFY